MQLRGRQGLFSTPLLKRVNDGEPQPFSHAKKCMIGRLSDDQNRLIAKLCGCTAQQRASGFDRIAPAPGMPSEHIRQLQFVSTIVKMTWHVRSTPVEHHRAQHLVGLLRRHHITTCAGEQRRGADRPQRCPDIMFRPRSAEETTYTRINLGLDHTLDVAVARLSQHHPVAVADWRSHC